MDTESAFTISAVIIQQSLHNELTHERKIMEQKRTKKSVLKKAVKMETVSAEVNRTNYAATRTLDSLPEEVLIQILKCLSFLDLIKVVTVNKKLFALLRCTELWKNMTFLHFGNRETAESSWYDAFVCIFMSFE